MNYEEVIKADWKEIIDGEWADIDKFLDKWQKIHGWATLDRKQIIIGYLEYLEGDNDEAIEETEGFNGFTITS